jgi:single-strand DNA-binding protein
VANLNKVMLIGRLTRDPEIVNFSNGGKVAKFGFAVNNRKKDQTTGQWVEEPVFLEVEAFNRGDFGKKADLVQQYLGKGRQVYIEGHLKLNQWEQDGQKKSKLLVILDDMQFLDSRQDGMTGGSSSGTSSMPARPMANPRPAGGDVYPGSYGDDTGEPASFPMPQSSTGGKGTEEIPF